MSEDVIEALIKEAHDRARVNGRSAEYVLANWVFATHAEFTDQWLPLMQKREAVKACLRCGKGYEQTHKFNRLCPSCTEAIKGIAA